MFMEHHEHHPEPKEEKPRHIDDVVNPYSVWATPPSYRREPQYHLDVRDYDTAPSFRSNAPVTEMRPRRRIVLLPKEWIGEGVRGYCVPTMNRDVCWIRADDPDIARVAYHEDGHFAKLDGGDGSEGYVRLLEHLRLGHEEHNGYH